MKRKIATACSADVKCVSLLPAMFLLLLINAVPAAADMVRIYVTNAAGDSVHVIDPATNKVVAEISVAPGSFAVAV